MSTENKNVKKDLLRLFDEGKTEAEAFEELSKTSSSHPVSLKVISNWFTKFKLGDQYRGDKKLGRKSKFTDEYLINLVNENPELSLKELAGLANTTALTISKRLKEINSCEQRANYIMKGYKNGVKRFTDEHLIGLINENPGLSMRELAKLANVATSTVSKRLKQIKTDGKEVNYIIKGTSHELKRFTDEHLINLINDNPEFGLKELAELTNVTESAISNRLKQFKIKGKDVNYVNKSQHKGPKKFTDEHLINLINENPELGLKELAELTNTVESTISTRIKQIKIKGKDVNYVKKGTSGRPTIFTDEHLINLINENPGLDLKQLAELTNTTESTISKRLKQFKIKGKDVNYINKSQHKGSKKITDEQLINLVNENPELDMKEIAKLANVATSTVSKRLKQIKIKGKDVNYVKKGTSNRSAKFTDEHLINLINENPEFGLKELAELTNVTESTISKRLKQFETNGKDANYVKKGTHAGSTRPTDEHLINLINENPELDMKEIAKLANVTAGTVSKRLKQIEIKGKDVNYVNKGTSNRSTRFTDEHLINLINDNPGLNMAELAKLVNTSKATISARIKKININGERVNYIKKK